MALVDARGISPCCDGFGESETKGPTVREHRCPTCSLTLHRDLGEAWNTRARGLAS